MSPERGSLLDWIRYDARIGFLALLVAAPGTLVALVILWTGEYSARIQWTVSAFLAVTWLGGTLLLRERLVRPLQTLKSYSLLSGVAIDFSMKIRCQSSRLI